MPFEPRLSTRLVSTEARNGANALAQEPQGHAVILEQAVEDAVERGHLREALEALWRQLFHIAALLPQGAELLAQLCHELLSLLRRIPVAVRVAGAQADAIGRHAAAHVAPDEIDHRAA